MHHRRRRFVSMHALAVFAAAAAWVTPPSRANEPMDAAQTAPGEARARELRALLQSGLSDQERERSVAALADLRAAIATIERIDQEVVEQFRAAQTEQDEGVPSFVDVTVLWYPFDPGASPVSWAMAQEAMRRYDAAGVLSQLREVSLAPRFPTWEQPIEDVSSTLTYVNQARYAATVLRASAWLRARSGDATGATDELRSMLRLGAMLGRAPCLSLELLVGGGATAMATVTVRGLMHAGLFDGPALQRLGQAMDESLSIPDRAAAADTVALENLMLMDKVIAQLPPEQRRALREQARGVVADFHEQYVRLARLRPFERALAETPNADAIIARHRVPLSPLNVALDLVEFPRTHRLVDQIEAESHGVRLAIAVEAYRLRHGELPASLDVLVPEFIAALPVDAYAPDGRFRYQFHPVDPERRAGFVIYSVGLDGVDDGGTFSDNFWGSRYDATSGQCTKCDLLIYPVTE
jgi:hypothetical protein